MRKILLVSMMTIFPAAMALAQGPFKVGDKVPDFKLPYATRDTIDYNGISSQDLAGKRYLLAFYPADWSPGCTKEVCSFRDNMSQFEKLGLVVLGVSVDNPYSHQQWARFDSLNFKLLSDQTHKLGETMGVYLPEQGVFQRSVFVVGPDGRFQYINYNYSVANDNDFNALKAALGK